MRQIILTSICLLFTGIFCYAQYIVTTNVKTPNNSTVPDTRIFTGTDLSYSPTQLAAMAADLQANYSAELISAPTKKYNCHAYAWHVSEGGSQVWIGYSTSTAEDIYWTDESYMEVPDCITTKVSYHETGNHSAIKLDNTWYQSKWGDGPLVKHYLNNVPSGYKPSLQKKYYLRTPSISGPSVVCSSGATFTINNLPPVDSIIWETGPYLTVDSGQYTNLPVIKATGNSSSWVRGRLVNDCGSITLPQHPVWAGKTRIDNIQFSNQGGMPGSWCIFSTGNTFNINYQSEGNTTFQSYLKTIPGGTVVESITGSSGECYYNPSSPGFYLFETQATNTCGTTEVFSAFVEFTDCSRMMLVLSPNPTSGETLLTIGSESETLNSASSGDTGVDDNVEWHLEVYSPMLALKTKKTKLKGKSTTIQTSGWMEGVYSVRVKYKDEILTGKLVVKR